MIEACRQEMAEDAQKSIELFHQGKLKPQSLESIIADLDDLLEKKAFKPIFY